MWWAIDLLASEYGWAKGDILNDVYVDELFYLSQKINKRKLNDYKLWTAIIQSPHLKDSRRIWDTFKSMEGELQIDEPAKLDVTGMEAAKLIMRKNPRFVVK